MVVFSYKRVFDAPRTDFRAAWLMFMGVVEKDDVLMLIFVELWPFFRFDCQRKPGACKIELSGFAVYEQLTPGSVRFIIRGFVRMCW